MSEIKFEYNMARIANIKPSEVFDLSLKRIKRIRTLASDGDLKDIQAYTRMLTGFKERRYIEKSIDCLEIIINIATEARRRLQAKDRELYFDEIY